MLQYSNYNSVEILVIELKKSNFLMESFEHFLWKERVRRFPPTELVLFCIQWNWIIETSTDMSLLCDVLFVSVIGFYIRTSCHIVNAARKLMIRSTKL